MKVFLTGVCFLSNNLFGGGSGLLFPNDENDFPGNVLFSSKGSFVCPLSFLFISTLNFLGDDSTPEVLFVDEFLSLADLSQTLPTTTFSLSWSNF